MRIFWIIGASQGIGIEVVHQLLKHGNRVIASARYAENNANLLQLENQYRDQLRLLNLDVTQSAEFREKIHQAWSFWQGIDTWLYNAGHYQPMSLQASDNEQFKQMNEVNYLGCAYLMNEIFSYRQAHAPERSMAWFWNASLASQFGLPYGGAYSAPKAALVNLAEAVQPELAAHGIQLHLINHGFVKTRLTDKNAFAMPGLMSAQNAAEQIVRSMTQARRFEITFPLALSFFMKLLKFLPYALSLKLTKRLLK